jgi:Mg-chelatase subunit ChlD
MRCQHVDEDVQCRMDATRRVLVGMLQDADRRRDR